MASESTLQGWESHRSSSLQSQLLQLLFQWTEQLVSALAKSDSRIVTLIWQVLYLGPHINRAWLLSIQVRRVQSLLVQLALGFSSVSVVLCPCWHLIYVLSLRDSTQQTGCRALDLPSSSRSSKLWLWVNYYGTRLLLGQGYHCHSRTRRCSCFKLINGSLLP